MPLTSSRIVPVFHGHVSVLLAQLAGTVGSIAEPLANFSGAAVDITGRVLYPRDTLVAIAGQRAHLRGPFAMCVERFLL